MGWELGAGLVAGMLSDAGASAGQAALRWVAGWPEASLSHKAAKPWVG